MATETAANGVIKVGANDVAEVTGYTLNYTSETIEDTVIGDTTRSYKSTMKNYTISMDVFYDQTDTNGQLALAVGEEISFALYPSGETSGDMYYSGTGLVMSKSISGAVAEMIRATIEVQGVGDLTESTVV